MNNSFQGRKRWLWRAGAGVISVAMVATLGLANIASGAEEPREIARDRRWGREVGRSAKRGAELHLPLYPARVFLGDQRRVNRCDVAAALLARFEHGCQHRSFAVARHVAGVQRQDGDVPHDGLQVVRR